MDAARIGVIVESMCTATEDSKLSVRPRGGCSSKCVAQTPPFSNEVDQIDIVSRVHEESFAEKSQSLLYGYCSTKCQNLFLCHEALCAGATEPSRSV